MTRVTSVMLDERANDFIDEQVSNGHYSSARDVIDAGLKLLRGQAEIEAIRAAIIEGEESGEAEPFDGEAFLEELHRKYVK
jgi:antitoxin ParD1/3/4